jgi:hypothetical protein
MDVEVPLATATKPICAPKPITAVFYVSGFSAERPVSHRSVCVSQSYGCTHHLFVTWLVPEISGSPGP